MGRSISLFFSGSRFTAVDIFPILKVSIFRASYVRLLARDRLRADVWYYLRT